MAIPELNPIKWEISFLEYLKFSYILVLLFFWVYFYFSKTLFELLEKTPAKIITKKWRILKKIEKLQKNIWLSRSEFYLKLNEILKEVVMHKDKKNIYPKTLEEIQRVDLEPELKALIKQIYSLIYSDNSIDDLDFRNNILEKTLENLK